jgi:hypothetical protein
VLATGYHPKPSLLGVAWTAVTAVVMFGLAGAKARVSRALDNPVLRTESRITMVDALLATAVLIGLTLNAWLRWWWADTRELCHPALRPQGRPSCPQGTGSRCVRRKLLPDGSRKPASMP